MNINAPIPGTYKPTSDSSWKGQGSSSSLQGAEEIANPSLVIQIMSQDNVTSHNNPYHYHLSITNIGRLNMPHEVKEGGWQDKVFN